MNDQTELFPPEQSTEPCSVIAEARARAGDPATSHEAANRVEENSTARHQRTLVLEMVKAFPGLSSAELASQMIKIKSRAELNRYVFARRLPELRKAGFVGHKRISPPAGVCRWIECVKFNTTVHMRAIDGTAAWWSA